MKKRILVLLTVMALMVVMVAISAAPAFARLNCEFDITTFTSVCSGGEGGQGGGFGFHREEDFLSSDIFFSGGTGGGGGGAGGGTGGHCRGNQISGDVVCHGRGI
jgi:fibronectin-binding autotransporter adhesin